MDGTRPSVCDCAADGCLLVCASCGTRVVPVRYRPKVRQPCLCRRVMQLTDGCDTRPPIPLLPPRHDVCDGSTGRRAVRMGQHVWLLLATIGTEMLAITKWSQGQFPEPLPRSVRWAWAVGATLLVLYPTVRVCGVVLCFEARGQLTGGLRVRPGPTWQFGLPATRRYLRQHRKNGKPKST